MAGMETAIWILVGMAIIAWLGMAGLMAYLWIWTLRHRWLRRTHPESADSKW